jgi:hypothetical protein
MSKSDDRVLTRLHARVLTEAEMDEVAAALYFPRCTFDPKTCQIDGFCSPEPAC